VIDLDGPQGAWSPDGHRLVTEKKQGRQKARQRWCADWSRTS